MSAVYDELKADRDFWRQSCRASDKRIAELELNEHTKDAFYGDRIAELKELTKEARLLLEGAFPSVCLSDGQGDEWLRRRTAWLRAEEVGDE